LSSVALTVLPGGAAPNGGTGATTDGLLLYDGTRHSVVSWRARGGETGPHRELCWRGRETCCRQGEVVRGMETFGRAGGRGFQRDLRITQRAVLRQPEQGNLRKLVIAFRDRK
jgi:hypothetical protein